MNDELRSREYLAKLLTEKRLERDSKRYLLQALT